MILPRGRPAARRRLLQHLARARLHREEQTASIDVVDEVPVLRGRLQERPHPHHAGVVHQDIEAAEALDRARTIAALCSGSRRSARKASAVPPDTRISCGDGVHALLGDIHRHHRRALAGVAQRDRPADSPATAGDHRHTPIQLAMLSNSSLLWPRRAAVRPSQSAASPGRSRLGPQAQYKPRAQSGSRARPLAREWREGALSG